MTLEEALVIISLKFDERIIPDFYVPEDLSEEEELRLIRSMRTTLFEPNMDIINQRLRIFAEIMIAIGKELGIEPVDVFTLPDKSIILPRHIEEMVTKFRNTSFLRQN